MAGFAISDTRLTFDHRAPDALPRSAVQPPARDDDGVSRRGLVGLLDLLCRGLLVIANAAVQIAHFRDKAVLGNRLWVAWSWKHVAADFSNFTFRLLPCSK